MILKAQEKTGNKKVVVEEQHSGILKFIETCKFYVQIMHSFNL